MIKGTFVTLSDIMKEKNIGKLRAKRMIEMLQEQGVLGQEVEGEGYPVVYS